MRTSLDWLIARPIAHRGLHDAAHGIIENTAGAMRAAIAANYGIETDVQTSADGEAMVHHDDVLGRLTEGEGRLDSFTSAQLKRVTFHHFPDRVPAARPVETSNSGPQRLVTEGEIAIPLRRIAGPERDELAKRVVLVARRTERSSGRHQSNS